MQLEAMYQEVILDHYRNPHHKGLREPFEGEAHHVNPMTGEDEFALAEAALSSAATLAPSRPRAEPVKVRGRNGAVDPEDESTWGRVARNAPCPCGSGKKYKHCHGKHSS